MAAGETRQETLELIKEAIEFHVEGLRADGEKVPEPRCEVEHIDTDAAQSTPEFDSWARK